MRVTDHSGRYNRNGVFSAKHNDREFDVSKADHIDATRQNIEWNIYEDNAGFDAVEKKFYEKHFSGYLEIQNIKYKLGRNYSRIKTMDQYRRSKQTCPEEVILQIGNKDETVNDEMAVALFEEYIDWMREKFPNCVIVDYAIHFDETTPHCHLRRVWIGHDEKYNREVVSQSKALREMGIGLETLHTRFDNPKKIFTKMCRDYFEKLCEDHGIEVEHERLPDGKRGKELVDFQIAKEQERCDVVKQKLSTLEEDVEKVEEQARTAVEESVKSEERAKAAAAEEARARAEVIELKNEVEQEKLKLQKLHEKSKQERAILDLAYERSKLKNPGDIVEAVSSKLNENMSIRNRWLEKDNERLKETVRRLKSIMMENGIDINNSRYSSKTKSASRNNENERE